MSDTPPPAEFLAVESAGRLAGISPRTLRHWIATGKLSAIAGKRGKLVSIVQVRRLAMLTGKVAGNDAPPDGNPATSAERLAEEVAGNLAGNVADPSGGTPGSHDTALIDTVRRAEAEALVQRLLAPFIAELGAVREELGRVKAERDAAEAARLAAEGERDALRLRLAEVAVPPVVVVAAQDAAEAPPATTSTPASAQGLWTRLRRTLRGR